MNLQFDPSSFSQADIQATSQLQLSRMKLTVFLALCLTGIAHARIFSDVKESIGARQGIFAPLGANLCFELFL